LLEAYVKLGANVESTLGLREFSISIYVTLPNFYDFFSHNNIEWT